ARTVADLGGSEAIGAEHVAESLGFRLARETEEVKSYG
ncbi:MAG: hypothetical protein ACKVS6_09345, partial [Planctomycetota bacterium]